MLNYSFSKAAPVHVSSREETTTLFEENIHIIIKCGVGLCLCIAGYLDIEGFFTVDIVSILYSFIHNFFNGTCLWS